MSASSIATDLPGNWIGPSYWVTDQEAMARFARATGVTNPEILAGRIGAPVYGSVPCSVLAERAFAHFIPDDVMRTGLNGASDLVFHRSLEPDMELVSKAKAVGIRPAGSRVLAVIKGETRTPDDELVYEQWEMMVFPTAVPDAAGEEWPKLGVEGEDVVASFAITSDSSTPLEYAKVSGNYWPTHTDEKFAQGLGLPSVILHGQCTLALISNGFIEHLCDGDPGRLRRLGARYSWYVMPSQEVTTTVVDGGVDGGRHRYGFSSELGDGQVVLKDGIVEVD